LKRISIPRFSIDRASQLMSNAIAFSGHISPWRQQMLEKPSA
jgi:hypothetical protein